MARELEQDMHYQEAQEWREFKVTRVWTAEQQQKWEERRAKVERAWKRAHELSFAAGFDFTDRDGTRHHLTEESLAKRAVGTYARSCKFPYSNVVRWQSHYEAMQRLQGASRKRGRDGGKPGAKRRR